MATTFNPATTINGDTFEGFRLTVNVNGSALDLTSGSVETVVLAGGVYHSFSTTNGKMTIISGSAGIVEFNSQIIDFGTFGTFPIKIVFRPADSSVHTYVTGEWQILREP